MGQRCLASLAAAFVLGKTVAVTTVIHGALRDEGGSRHVAGFRGHGAVDRHAFRTEAPKLFLINTGYQLACYPVMGAILAGSGRY